MAKWTIPPIPSREEVADALWEEFKHWDGEKKFALREVVKYLRGNGDVDTTADPNE